MIEVGGFIDEFVASDLFVVLCAACCDNGRSVRKMVSDARTIWQQDCQGPRVLLFSLLTRFSHAVPEIAFLPHVCRLVHFLLQHWYAILILLLAQFSVACSHKYDALVLQLRNCEF